MTFPLRWLLDHASAPIQYRSTVEVARLFDAPPSAVANLPYTWGPALMLAASQASDGTWGNNMFTVPSKGDVEGIGAAIGVRRLLEAGWDRESPPLVRARRLLFRLLAEDTDPSYLFELGHTWAKGDDEQLVKHGRFVVREAAAAVLAQAGYEADPRLRGAARRIMERVNNFLKSPLAQKPFIRVGNKHVLDRDSAPPSVFTLLLLAHMPVFRNEHSDVMDRIYHFLTQPVPRQEAIQLVGDAFVAQPMLVMGDMLHTRNALDDDLGFGLFWLELMARLGFLRRHEGWSTLFERMLDQRDRDGVWRGVRAGRLATSQYPPVWSSFPLQDRFEGDGRYTDVTFRLGLIARLSGRSIELV